MIDTLIQARDDIRAVLSDTRPDLVSEFNANTGAADDPRWIPRFLDEHFPGQSWNQNDPKNTACLLRRVIDDQRSVAAVVRALRRNPALFGGLR